MGASPARAGRWARWTWRYPDLDRPGHDLWTRESDSALSSRTSTLSDLAGNILYQSSGLDVYDGTTGKITDLNIPKPKYPLVLFADETTDQMPITGGAGTYTTTITNTPEPSSFLIGAVSGLAVLIYVFWERDRQARCGLRLSLRKQLGNDLPKGESPG
jgi:hypothetical protein